MVATSWAPHSLLAVTPPTRHEWLQKSQDQNLMRVTALVRSLLHCCIPARKSGAEREDRATMHLCKHRMHVGTGALAGQSPSRKGPLLHARSTRGGEVVEMVE